MKRKPWQKNFLSAAVVVAGGSALFLLSFLLLALATNVSRSLFSREGSPDLYALVRLAGFALTVLLLPLVFRSKLPDPLKAAYLTLPLMAAMVMLGIALHASPSWMAPAAGAAVLAAVLALLAARKKPWPYFLAVLFTAALALCIVLSGAQI